MRRCTVAGFLAFILAVVVNAQVPAMMFASPRPFLGLEDALTSESVSKIVFVPGLHACGSLLVLSAQGLRFDDFALLDKEQGSYSSLVARFEAARSKRTVENAQEDQLVEWARGWRTTCGRGTDNMDVRVAKVAVDALRQQGDREQAVRALDAAVQGHLTSLPKAPHEHMVVLTSVSPETLMKLFDIAALPVSGPKTSPEDDVFPDIKGHVWEFVSALFNLALTSVLSVAFAFAVYKGWERWNNAKRRKRRIQLADNLDLDLDAE